METANPPLHQMVLNKLVTFLCNLIILRCHPRIKAQPSYEIIASDVALENLGEGASSSSSSSSVSGSCLADDLEGESCCVCMSRLKEKDDMRVLPCLHRFHRECVDRWFNAWTKTCPLCRFSIGEEVKFRTREVLLTDEMVLWFSSFHVAGF